MPSPSVPIPHETRPNGTPPAVSPAPATGTPAPGPGYEDQPLATSQLARRRRGRDARAPARTREGARGRARRTFIRRGKFFRPPVSLPVGIPRGTRPAPNFPWRGTRPAPRASTPAGVLPAAAPRDRATGPTGRPMPPHSGRPPQRRQGGRTRRVLIGFVLTTQDFIARSARPCPRPAPDGGAAPRAARGWAPGGGRRPGRRPRGRPAAPPHARRGRPPRARGRGGPTAGTRERARWPGPPARGAGREPAGARPATTGDGHPPVGGDAGGDDDDGGRILRAGKGRAHVTARSASPVERHEAGQVPRGCESRATHDDGRDVQGAVPAGTSDARTWVPDPLGGAFAIPAGRGVQDEVRAAIPLLSVRDGSARSVVPTSTGGSELEGQRLDLHAGGDSPRTGRPMRSESRRRRRAPPRPCRSRPRLPRTSRRPALPSAASGRAARSGAPSRRRRVRSPRGSLRSWKWTWHAADPVLARSRSSGKPSLRLRGVAPVDDSEASPSPQNRPGDAGPLGAAPGGTPLPWLGTRTAVPPVSTDGA
jgi:hypothetical protein